ncbi:MAG TPA: translocation/assembly module TamB domain-containing protein [Chitinophagales bacterium]|nr:translocation/assembly module TamB domain-containing protein [Chitinophagales bacterium]
MKKFFKYTLRTVLVILLLLFILFISAFYLIQQPKVQTFLVHKVSEYLSKQLGSEVKVDSVSIDFIRTLEIYNVYLSTQKSKTDTLLFAKKLDVDLMLGKTLLDQISSIQEKKIYIDNVALDGVKFNGYRAKNDSFYNFHFLLEQFASKDTKPKEKKASKPIVLRVNKILLTNSNLVLDDPHTDKRMDIRFTKVYADVREFNITPMKIDVRKLELVDPFYKLTDYNEIDKIKDPNKPPSKGFNVQGLGKKLNITVDELTLKNANHAMDFKKKNQKAGTFLISQMNIHDVDINIKNYRWDSTGMHVGIKNLTGICDNNLNIKKLQANALLDNGGIYLDDADIEYNSSIVKGNLSIQFTDEWRSFSDFENKVIMKADIKEVFVKSKDVAVFAPTVQKFIPEHVYMRGFIKGKLSNLRAESLYITAGKNTIIDVSGNIKGLPHVNQTLFDLKVNQLKTNPADLKQILNYVKIPAQLDNAGNMVFKGTYFGFINDFVAKGTLKTDHLGEVITDLRMSFPKGKAPNYSGKVIANGLNLAELTGNKKLLGTVDLDINADGNGFSTKDLNTKLTGTLRNFYFNGFVFDKIKVDGLIEKKKFKGKAFFDDDCFLVDFNGSADFNDKVPKFDFVTSIKNADLHKLNFTKDTMMISLDGEVHGSGDKIDNFTGTGKFSNIILQNTKDMLVLSDVDINLKNDGVIKDYTITSDQFNANLNGNFDPLSIVPSMKVFLSKYSQLIKPTEKDYKLAKPQQVDATVKLKSDFGLIKVFVPKLQYISELDLNTTINTSQNVLEINAKMDSANYDDIAFNNIYLDGNTNNTDLLLNANVENLRIKKTDIKEIKLGLNSSLEQLLSNLSISNDTSDNSVRMLSILDFKGDSIIAKIIDSELKLNKKIWQVQKGNELIIVDSIFLAQNFSLIQGEQKINIQNGRNTLSDAKINIENLNLTDVGQLIDSTGIIRNGTLSGTVNLKNMLTKLQANADVTINNLQVLDYKVKYIGLDGIYGRNGKKMVEAGGTIEDKDYQLSFDGIYDMQTKGKEKLDVNADIEKVNLSFLESVLKKELLVPRAFVKGQVNISGNLKKPILTGTAQVIDTAELKLRLLGTTFKLANEEIKLTQRGFDFGNVTLFDNFGNTALLTGKLLHTGFKDWKVEKANLSAPTGYNFMNTTFDDNQDFYGKVFAKGDVDIDGYFNDLTINVNRLETLKNTVFNLPVSDKASDKGYTFIKFVDPKDTIKKIDYKSKISGLNINMNITATNDAEIAIILDQAANDKIVGRGEGDLNFTMDKKGELSINGTYNLTEGKYDFNFQGILNKTFKIGPGSKIVFNGDPLKAELAVNALYNIKSASVRNLFDSTDANGKLIRNRTFPIDLNLLISGTLDKTAIGFKIQPTSVVPDALDRKLVEINSNQNEVNNQAGFLLLFNSFFPTGTSDQKVSGYSNTVTQLISDQISKILSQGLGSLIKGASVDVLLSDLESKESRNFGFSYKQEILGGKLILTIGGNVNFGNSSSNINSVTGQPANNAAIAGDFVLEYLVTSDGRIRLKTYARTANYNIINQDRIQTGGAISFQKDFDNFKDLFKRKPKPEKVVLDLAPPQDTSIIFTPKKD